jgi:hypothetical protein
MTHLIQQIRQWGEAKGIVVFHVAGNVGFKKTIEKDHSPKGNQ